MSLRILTSVEFNNVSNLFIKKLTVPAAGVFSSMNGFIIDHESLYASLLFIILLKYFFVLSSSIMQKCYRISDVIKIKYTID
jgi:hypothetical protein